MSEFPKPDGEAPDVEVLKRNLGLLDGEFVVRRNVYDENGEPVEGEFTEETGWRVDRVKVAKGRQLLVITDGAHDKILPANLLLSWQPEDPEKTIRNDKLPSTTELEAIDPGTEGLDIAQIARIATGMLGGVVAENKIDVSGPKKPDEGVPAGGDEQDPDDVEAKTDDPEIDEEDDKESKQEQERLQAIERLSREYEWLKTDADNLQAAYIQAHGRVVGMASDIKSGAEAKISSFKETVRRSFSAFSTDFESFSVEWAKLRNSLRGEQNFEESARKISELRTRLPELFGEVKQAEGDIARSLDSADSFVRSSVEDFSNSLRELGNAGERSVEAQHSANNNAETVLQISRQSDGPSRNLQREIDLRRQSINLVSDQQVAVPASLRNLRELSDRISGGQLRNESGVSHPAISDIMRTLREIDRLLEYGHAKATRPAAHTNLEAEIAHNIDSQVNSLMRIISDVMRRGSDTQLFEHADPTAPFSRRN